MAKKDPAPAGKPPPTSKETVTPPRRPGKKPPEAPAMATRQPAAARREPASRRTRQADRRRRITPRTVALIVLILLALVVAADLTILEGRWPFGGRAAQTVTNPNAPLAQFFSPSVLHWEPEIEVWAKAYDVNPNVIALVMQIESCGDPVAISPAGALGLMQVMPFHFENGENMLNPDTNVRRGMNFFHECLKEHADWDVGLALACYNGGPGVVYNSRDEWPAETRRYYQWATGLWQDVVRGDEDSVTLSDWLSAGGQNLCTRASRRLSGNTDGR